MQQPRSGDRKARSRSTSPRHSSYKNHKRKKDSSYKSFDVSPSRKLIQSKIQSIEHSKSSRNDHGSKSRDRSSSKSKRSKKRNKKPSKEDSDSDSDNSSQSDSSIELLKKLHEERLRQKDDKKKVKQQMKAGETPEEKRARRLLEKQEKERRRRERMGWDGEYQCYTNQDNPFGDSALTQTFVWGKKLAKEGVRVVSRDQLETQNRQKQFENKIELEKVKRRRQEREVERAAREAEASAAQRAREAQQFDSWARQEDAFHLKQATLRTQIRIRDGRAKPIDLLAWYVSSEEGVDALEMHEPYTYLNGLQATDLEDLLEDIKVYMELEKESNQSYWDDVTTIVRDELEKLRRLGAAGSSQVGEAASRRDGIHHAVAQDVTQVFKGKTGTQLEALQRQIEGKISARQDGVDIGYWESLLSQLKAHRARARLRDRHQRNLRRKLQLLKEEQGVEGVSNAESQQAQQPSTSQLKHERPDTPHKSDKEEADEQLPAEQDLEAALEATYKAGNYSPVLIDASRVEPGTVLIDEADDEERQAFLRSRLHAAKAAQHHKDSMSIAAIPLLSVTEGGEAAMEREARRGMGGDEAVFSVEATLPAQPCLWSDKYRPRKPRYFNRVHTGFEWNKYNQTHYDMDNPPPKIVQGYKFNIFYPDLIDSNSTPHFSLKPCPDNPDFAELRFTAGPPYEDIAFKIVNREWEYSYKRGFRCHFHNNIFQLWFHFKRYRYRR